MTINLTILDVRLDVDVSHKDDGPGPRSLYSVIYRKYDVYTTRKGRWSFYAKRLILHVACRNRRLRHPES